MVRDIKEQGKNGVMEPNEENFKNEAVTENVRYSSEVQKEGTVQFIWQYNEKSSNMPILHIKLKCTEINWFSKTIGLKTTQVETLTKFSGSNSSTFFTITASLMCLKISQESIVSICHIFIILNIWLQKFLSKKSSSRIRFQINLLIFYQI